MFFTEQDIIIRPVLMFNFGKFIWFLSIRNWFIAILHSSRN